MGESFHFRVSKKLCHFTKNKQRVMYIGYLMNDYTHSKNKQNIQWNKISFSKYNIPTVRSVVFVILKKIYDSEVTDYIKISNLNKKLILFYNVRASYE